MKNQLKRSDNEVEATISSDDNCSCDAVISRYSKSLFGRSLSDAALATHASAANLELQKQWDTGYVDMQGHYDEAYEKIMAFSGRSYEGKRWFYLVAKPFNDKFEKYEEWYGSRLFPQNVIRQIQKIDKKMEYFYVVERNAAKPHVNILFNVDLSNVDKISALHDTNRYRAHYWVDQLPDLGDRQRVAKYIIKEFKIRLMYRPEDYAHKYKTESTQRQLRTRCQNEERILRA